MTILQGIREQNSRRLWTTQAITEHQLVYTGWMVQAQAAPLGPSLPITTSSARVSRLLEQYYWHPDSTQDRLSGDTRQGLWVGTPRGVPCSPQAKGEGRAPCGLLSSSCCCAGSVSFDPTPTAVENSHWRCAEISLQEGAGPYSGPSIGMGEPSEWSGAHLAFPQRKEEVLPPTGAP